MKPAKLIITEEREKALIEIQRRASYSQNIPKCYREEVLKKAASDWLRLSKGTSNGNA